MSSFDPRLRDGGDLSRFASMCNTRCFDPRLRDGGDRQCGQGHCQNRGFDPRLRDGGDDARAKTWLQRAVSIHASVMEATRRLSPQLYTMMVSIHASVMEATPC